MDDDANGGALMQAGEEREGQGRRERGAFASDELASALMELPARERLVLLLRLGLGEDPPRSLGEVAVKLGVTPERVRRLEQRARRRLADVDPKLVHREVARR